MSKEPLKIALVTGASRGIGRAIAVDFAKKMAQYGAGELLVTSMDRDGTQKGYDIDLTKKISNSVNIPVIASGGVGNLNHLYLSLIHI